MNIFILYMFIATAGTQYSTTKAWVANGEYAGLAACQEAAKRLNRGGDTLTACIDTKRAAQAAAKGAA